MGEVEGSENILKSIYNQLIINEEYLDSGQHKVLMLIAHYRGIDFTYHHNILVNNQTTFEDYYNSIKDNISKLYADGYQVHDVMNFNMRV